jgi:hypothetical protein
VSKVQDQMEKISNQLGLGLDNQQIVDVVYSSVEELVENGLEGSDDVVYFYATCMLACAFGQLSLDRKASGFTFGFSDLKPIYTQLESELAVHSVENQLKNQLAVSDLRSNSLKDLKAEQLEHFLIDDIATVSKALDLEFDSTSVSSEVKESLVSVEDETLNKKIKLLKTASKLVAEVSSMITQLFEIYDYAFEAGYELDKYEGVVVGLPDIPMVIIQGEQAVQPNYTASYYAGEAMFSPLRNVRVSTSRQIDLQEILNSDKPIYYPYKILEFALSRKVTVKKDDLNFPSVPMKWNGSDGQRQAIEDYLRKRAWEYLTLVCDTYQDGYFWSDKVNYFGEGYTVAINPKDTDVFRGYLRKLKDTFSTFAIMKSHVGLMDDEKWASAEWVVSAPISELQNGEFTKDSLFYTDVFDYGGDFEEPLTRVFSNVQVSHYTHIAKPEIAESEPLFAYKALESLQRKGEKLTYGYQLLGKGLDGRILTASNDMTAAVNAGAKLVLAYWAGSRSGKGVSISNGLAVSIANGRPVFGGDGKPDTMVPYYIAFGGADENGIPKGYFIQAGVFNKSAMPVVNNISEQLDWDNNPTIMGWFDKSIPKWFSGVSSSQKRYTGAWGDMAFYRHMLLVMGIVSLRATVKASDVALYEKLGGDEGILGIFDEVTNWSNLFGSKALSSNGGWFQSIMSDPEVEELVDLGENYLGGLLKEQATRKFERALENKSDEYRNRAYLRDLYDKLDESMQLLNKLKKAGFQNEESLRSSIYIVGQSFNMGGFDKLPRNKGNDASSFKAACDYKNGVVDPWLYTLLNLDTGFMVGYKGTEKSQYWSSQNGSDSKRYLTSSSRRFAYFGSVDFPTIRDENPQNKGLARSVNSQMEGGAVYFKPYLILGDSQGSCVTQLEKNLGSKAESIKSRNSNPNNPSEWDERIGVLGYLKALGSSDISKSFVRAREIADLVVAQMGYEGSYLEFLLDLRPEWNFSCEDVVMAFTNQDAYLAKKKETVYYKVDELLNELVEFKQSGGATEGSDLTKPNTVDLRPEFATKEVKADEVEELTSLSEEEDTSNFSDLHEELISEPTSESPVSSESDLKSSVDNLESEPQKWTREQSEPSESIPLKTPNTEPLNVASTLASQLGVSESALMSVLQSAFGLQGSSIPKVETIVSTEELNDRTTMSRVATNRAESTVIKNDQDLREYLLEDIYTYFGDWSRVRKIEIIGRQLYFNGLLYEPEKEGIQFSPEVSPYSISLWNSGGFGELFDWKLIRQYLNPTSLVFDSMDYAYREFDLMESSSSKVVVENAFKRYSMLQDLQVGTYTFTRAEVEEMILERQPFLSSYDRRQQVFRRGTSKGKSFRQKRWQKAREHMAEGHTGRAVASALGAGLGVGFQGASHVGGFFNKAARVFRQAGSSVAENWREQDNSKH